MTGGKKVKSLLGKTQMHKSEALNIIANNVAKCTLCEELTNYRKENNYQTVPGTGNPNAQIMIVGEAPGKNEAEQGLPFVGRAGNLLTNIIESCGWERDDIFIANVLKCRPPGNRDPSPAEASNCRKYLDLQIQCVQPQWIICLGKISSCLLLGYTNDVSMGSLRGIHEYQGKKVLCTYHPSYLLRNPSAKELVWEDLQPVVKEVQ